jgi:hypothetical protein
MIASLCRSQHTPLLPRLLELPRKGLILLTPTRNDKILQRRILILQLIDDLYSLLLTPKVDLLRCKFRSLSDFPEFRLNFLKL